MLVAAYKKLGLCQEGNLSEVLLRITKFFSR